MRVLLIINLPRGSMEVIVLETVSTVEAQGIEVLWVYMNQFIEMMDTCPEMLAYVDLVHFIIDVQSFSYEHIKKAAEIRPILTSYHHWNFKEIPEQLQLVDHMFYVSKILEPEVKQLKPEKATISLLSNGVDPKVFCPKPNPFYTCGGYRLLG